MQQRKQMFYGSSSFSLLRIVLAVNETGAPYNQFTLSSPDQQSITLCTYFPPEVVVPKRIKVFAGDGTVLGFFRALKTAITADEYDIIHVHAPHVGLFFVVASLFLNIRLLRFTVYTVHSSYSHYELRHRLMLLVVFAFFRCIITCSYASFESLPRFFKLLGGKRICIIQNGVDIARIDRAIERNGICPIRSDNGTFTVITVGRLINIKQPEVVLRAFVRSNLPNSRLIYVGVGSLKADLIAESKALGIDSRVIFTDLIPRDQVYSLLACADLFVSASTVEGLPVAVLEALACRCPVILSDIASHHEIAERCDFIPLISPKDVVGFAREIIRISRMSTKERACLATRSRELAEKSFSLDKMHEAYQQVYAQIGDRRSVC